MKNKRTNLWLGLAVGSLAGVLAARKLVSEPRMPNARNWQRILSESRGQVPAAVLMARIQQAYEKLLERRPVFESTVFNIHVKDYILPGLALYQVLRESIPWMKTPPVLRDRQRLPWKARHAPSPRIPSRV